MLVFVLAALAAAPRVGLVVDVPAEASLSRADVIAREVAGGSFDVIRHEDMTKHFDAASSLGVVCASKSDADCVARVGAFAKLPLVLVITLGDAAGRGNDRRLRASLVDTASSTHTVAEGALSPDAATHEDTLRALLASVLRKEPLMSTIRVEVEPTALVEVDGTSHGTGAQVVKVAPGRHVVRASSDGRSASETLETFAGVASMVRVLLPSSATPPARGTAPEGEGIPPLAVGGLVCAGGSAVVAVGALVGALVVTPDPAARSDYTAREFNDATAAGQALFATAGVGAAALGASLVVAGVGLWAE